MISRLSIYFNYRLLPFRWYMWLTGGLLAACFLVIQQYTQHVIAEYDFAFSWLNIFLKHAINYLIWFLMLPWVHRVFENSTKYHTAIKRWMYLSSLSLVIIIVHRVASSRSIDIINYFNYGNLREFWSSNSQLEIGVGFFSSAIELAIILAIFMIAAYQKRWVEQQKNLARSQLNALRMQLNPHFIFNTLHSISSLIDIDVKKAQKMITKLGVLFRKVLEDEDQQFNTLEDELVFIREYLDIEQIRFDELKVKFEIDQNFEDQLVPNMILQPLIENAIKYGLNNENGRNEIYVRAMSSDLTSIGQTGLMMEIENYTDSNKTEEYPGTGLGLKNIKQRLSQLYGHFVLEANQVTSNKFVARIVIPINP